MPDTEPSRRLFFGLPLPSGLREQLVDWRDSLPLQGKPTAPANFHQTLVFLGQVPDRYLTPLCELAAQLDCPEFSLNYDKFGAWFRPGVFFVAPSQLPDPLLALVSQLNEGVKALGLAGESRRYRPHITLLRKVRKLPELDSRIPPLELQARRFVLYQSCSTREGVVYRELASWPLGEAVNHPR